jgi:multiple antibiotic resistance protein
MRSFALQTFVTLFVVMDPIGLGPVFLGLAGKRSAAERRRMATRAVVVAGMVLLLFGLGGSALLGYLHVSLDAFRVAGGILLFRIAAEMVFAQHERETEEEEVEARSRRDITVFPLAVPLIAGPGTLASMLLLAGQARAVPHGYLIVFACASLVLALVYTGLVLSDRVGRAVGQTGVNVFTRIFGIVLAAVAVQHVADGVRALLRN